jgi:hypothetical protein
MIITIIIIIRVETMVVNGPGNVIVCGHSDGRISLRAGMWVAMYIDISDILR